MTLPSDEDLAALLADATQDDWEAGPAEEVKVTGINRVIFAGRNLPFFRGYPVAIVPSWIDDAADEAAANTALIAHAPDLARAVIDLRAEVARLTAERDACLDALAAIERLARSLSISSCSCGTKSPDIQFHDGRCRYVLAQYILGQAEDALAIRAAAEGAP